jgi:hypothetical protein
MLKKLLVGLSPLLVVASFALAPAPALAYEVEGAYCYQNLAPSAGCPPNGSSQYLHLYYNLATDPYGNHESCVDDYVNGRYTTAKCEYYVGEYALESPGGAYELPRAWNGGSVEHFVEADEGGNH